MIPPHFRRERWRLAGIEVVVWACRTLDRAGYGQSWRTAYASWLTSAQHAACPMPETLQ